MREQVTSVRWWSAGLLILSLTGVSRAQTRTLNAEGLDEFLATNCRDCHDDVTKAADLSLDGVDLAHVGQDSALWEKVVRRLRARQMPPPDMPQPEEKEFRAVLSWLESRLDQEAAERPRPGRTQTFRRLTRTEYENAIRDLLALDVDAAALLPKEAASHGFDNVTVGDLSPTLLNRYISAAQKISRLAVGASPKLSGAKTFRVRPDVTQEEHVAGLPIGTRGGLLVTHTFPLDGEYEVRIRLARDRNEHVEGLRETHEMEVLLDRRPVAEFTVRPPGGKRDENAEYDTRSHANVDRHLKARIPVKAGPHQLGVTFLKNPSSLLESKRQPLNVHFNMYRHPRLSPAVYQVTVSGPFEADGSEQTPSRQRIFSCRPNGPDDEEQCARQILSTLLRRAYRRPIDEADFTLPLEMFRQSTEQGGDFETGIEMALSAVLVNPHFLFRTERSPQGLPAAAPYRVSDVELASRLSFFLWSSIPDEELLEAAEQGTLSDPQVLEQQTLRMLADDRARALVDNFAGQWLYLRNLESITPDMRLFPDFDDNLRKAFRQETELVFESVMREDRSVLELLKSDYTYLNERLAKHYDIPHVYGSHFRRVAVDESTKRGGLLRHGSILTVTSYATRTSPVIRGKWILENILGTPPPPPPDNVPPLEDNTVAANLSVRERLAQHRANPACASCHDLLDPVGFSLENFDAVGRWRDLEDGNPIDSSSGLPDGSQFANLAEFERGLQARPELFVGTMVEKLLTYALGRGLEHTDAPAVRRIVRDAEQNDFRFSSLILGIVKSVPFQMRTAE